MMEKGHFRKGETFAEKEISAERETSMERKISMGKGISKKEGEYSVKKYRRKNLKAIQAIVQEKTGAAIISVR
ncbi:MAG: hypothetical protein NC427_13585, partial [Ruminococcus flavefaciens]|nr:hypothetical protein [Ruminococcus flavefaciens]